MFFALANFVNAQTFSGTTGSITDDNSPNWDTFTASASGLASSTSINFGIEYVTIDITHTYDGDLNIELRSPNGTRITLTSGNGGGGENYKVTEFRMNAGTNITSGSAPFNGQYIPEDDLGKFNDGQDPNGTWTLYVQDDANNDVGTVDAWSITFSNNPAPPCGATNITSLPYSLTGQTTCDDDILFNSADACGSVFMNGQDEVYIYTPSSDGWVDIQITTDEDDGGHERAAAVFLLDECPTSGSATCMASSTVQYPSFHGSPHIIGELTAGVTYYIIVSNGPDPDVHNGDPCIDYDIAVTNINQPTPTTQDCFNAIPLCFASYTENNSFTESGNYPSEINSATSCLEGERNDVWYTFTVNVSGTVEFTIDPGNDGDDYDWAVYNITGETCSDVFSDPNAEVSCNYAMVPSSGAGSDGNTGPDGSTSQTSGGPNDSPFNAALNVVAGETYVVNVSMWSVSTSGYTINFGGTAQIVDTVGATLNSINNSPACGEDVITVEISENVLCNTVDPSDWTITGPSGESYTVTNVSSSICDAGGNYDKFFDLTLNTPLTAGGTYTLDLTGQIDDLCSHTTVGASLTFTVTGVSGTIDSQNDVTCPSGSNGAAAVSATGGTPEYTYIWDNPANSTTSSVSGLTAGTYHVTISDQVGVCQDIQTITISQPSPITVSFNTTDVQCNGDNDGVATANPSGGNGASWTYHWDAAAGGGTNATTSTLSAGTNYTVTVYDNQDCPQTATISVSEPSALAIDGILQQEPNCNGDSDGQLSVDNPNGGTPNYTYNWSSGGASTSQTNTGLTAGTFSVTVEDAHHCQLIQNNIVLGQPSAITNTNSITDATCNGSSTGSIATSASGGTGSLSYTWSANTGGQTSATASNLAAGNYDVTIEDTHSCQLIYTSLNVDEDPAIVITVTANNDATCGNSDGSATVSASGGSGSGFTYSWQGGQSGATISNVAAGGYDVTVSDSHSCPEVLTVNINNAAAPSISEVGASHVDVLCNGDHTGVAEVSGSGGTGSLSYAWSSSGNTGTTESSLGAGTYTVSVTDANNCSASMSITISEPTAVNVIISASQDPTCFGYSNGNATASSSGGVGSYTYSWSAGGTTSSATNTGLSANTTYTVTVQDGNNCPATATITLSEPLAVSIDATSFTDPLCFGDANGTATVTTVSGGTSGTGNYSYSWDTSPVQTGQTATGLTAGTYNVTVTDDNSCEATTSINLSQPVLVQASTTVTDVQCNGDNDGTATVTGTGGTGSFTYSWDTSPVQTSQTATGLIIGTYNVTITDGNSCTAITSATITEPTALTIASNTWQNVSCNGADDGYGIITGSGGTSPLIYSWDSGQMIDSIGSLSPGTYNLTITDANNCTIIDAVTITEPPVLAATVNELDASCHGFTDGSVSLSPTGGTTPYTYLWSNTETTQNISTGVGIYNVTITDVNLCEYITTGTINEPDTISVTFSTTESACGGTTGSATVNPIGGDNNFTYTWSTIPLQTAQTATNLASGAYNVSVTDGNNCEFVQTINVNDLGAAIIAIDTSGHNNCYGDTLGFAHVNIVTGTGPYSYSWENSLGVVISTVDTIFNLPADNYNVTVYDNGCESNASVQITENPELVLTSTYSNVSCYGYNDGQAIISPVGGYGTYTYSWIHDGTLADSTANNLVAGTYSVTVADALGCNDSAQYTINQPDLISIDFTDSTDVLCYGDSTGTAIISVSGGTQPYAQYQWSSGDASSTAVSLHAGYNSVTVTDWHGCTGEDSIMIYQPQPISFTISTANSVCGGSTGSIDITPLGGTSPYIYEWLHDTTLNSNIASNLAQGDYYVTVTDTLGCQNDTSASIVDDGAGTASISSVSDVLCNGESSGTATIDITGGTADFTYVISMAGISIDSTQSSNSSYDISNLVYGTYDVEVYDVNGCLSTTTFIVNQPTELKIADSTINVDCYNGSTGSIFITAFGGTPSYLYNWDIAGTDSAQTGLSAGSYSVTVVDVNACEKHIDSIQITQPTELIMSLDNATNLSCNNDSTGSISISATGGTPSYTYVWNDGQTGNNITGLNAGSYIVTITDNNLCNDTMSVMLTQPSVVLISDSIYYENHYGVISVSAVGGTPDYTYEWSNGETNNIINNLFSGDYWLTITDANGCVFTNYYNVEVELVVPSVITPNADGKNDKFRITNINAFEQVDIKIFNRWGDIIFDYAGTGIGYEDPEKQWDGTYNSLELPMGSYVYIIDLKNDKDPSTGTVTIVR